MPSDKNLKLINVFAFFCNAWFFVPIFLPYCKEHFGIGYQGMLMSEAVFAASCVIFDVPTGWISDVWRRKHALALGAAINICGVFVLLVGHNIWHLLLSQALTGIGISLYNGTHTALLYDSLLSLGRESEYRQREGQRQALAFYGIAAAGVIGGFAYTFNHDLPVWFALTAQSIVLVIACIIDEPERHKVLGKRHPVADIISTLKYVIHGHADVGIVMLLAAVLYSSTKIIMWSQQPYYIALGIPEAYFGVLMAAGWGLGGASSHMAHLFDGKINNFRALLVACGVAMILCIVAGAVPSYLGVVLLVIGGSCIYGMISPRVNEMINQRVDSSLRATMLSTQTFLASTLFIPASSMVGWITDHVSIGPALLSLVGWISLAGGVLLVWKRRVAFVLLQK